MMAMRAILPFVVAVMICGVRSQQVECPKEYWTTFYDRDNPSGDGDYETLFDLRKEHPGKICNNPSGIDVRLINGDPWASGGNTILPAHMSTTYGFACDNSNQPSWLSYPQCKDYKIRFCCLPDKPSCPYNGYWTTFFDRDNPSGNGDYETLSDLRREYPGKICKYPYSIDVRLLNGSYWYWGGNYINIPAHMNVAYGFACVNNLQLPNVRCQDYQIAFCCGVQEPTCKLPYGWTQWFDRDNPGGYGDYETAVDIRREYPGRLCDEPTAIYAELLDGRPWYAEGEIVQMNPQLGLACKNADQADKYCEDYKVKFCCIQYK